MARLTPEILRTTEYVGSVSFGAHIVKRVRGGRMMDLPLRLNISNHSPTGFAWGYGGSGPAQLALAILCDALGDNQRAARLHQRFKWKVIAGLDQNKAWVLPVEYVLKMVREIENEERNEERNEAQSKG